MHIQFYDHDDNHANEGRVALPSTFLQKVSYPNQDIPLLAEFTNSSSSESSVAPTHHLQSGHANVIQPSSVAPLEHDHTYFRKVNHNRKH